MIALENVSKIYARGQRPAVDDLSLTVNEGEFLALIGESGCGKTTTLKMINRLTNPTQGTIWVNGQPVSEQDSVVLRRSIGYVFQGIGLFPHYTVFGNIAAVPRLLGWSREEIESRVDEMMELVGLPAADYRNRMPENLSGGQQQRVGVARALSARQRVMLLDEPFGALDPITRAELQHEFGRIQDALGLTAILVTHDMTEALLMADRVAVMKDGQILQVGTPHELLTQPADEYVKQLVAMPKERADRLEALINEAG